MLRLWRKELRSLSPFLILVVFLMAMGLAFELSTGLPHLRPLAKTVDEYVATSGENVVVAFVVLFALASGLLVREYDDGTLEFLDALPLSRTHVFLAKVSAALMVPLLLIGLDIGVAVLLHACSRNSLDPGFHLSFLATAAGLRFCQALLFLSLGLALSFLRRFGWLIAGLLFWVYLVTRERWPVVRLFDVAAITQPVVDGQRWLIPWKPLCAQLALAGTLMLAAYVVFLGAGDWMLRSFRRLHQSRPGRAFLLVGSMAVVGVVLGIGYHFMQLEREDPDPEISFPTWSTARSRTRHYEFIYPSNLTERARRLTSQADAAHDEVVTLLGAAPQTGIVVDMTEVFARHAGLAYWEKIRMDVWFEDRTDRLLAVLGHETTHVYLDRESDSRLSDHFRFTRFFHEGVASYAEYHLFRTPEELDKLWSVAAVMRARRQVDFAELVDNDRLQARYDPNLAYPLGEMFVEALVRCHGEAAIGQVTRAFVRDNAPQDLTGLALWRDVFQACGFSLERVQTEFYAKLDEQVERQRDFIDTVPRLRGTVRVVDDGVEVQVLGQPPEGWHIDCRFREADDTPDREYMPGIPEEEQRFWMTREYFPAGTCWYQLGVTDGQDRTIYEPWQRVPLRP